MINNDRSLNWWVSNMDVKFSLEVKKLKNIVLFSPEIGQDDSSNADGSITIKIKNGKLSYSILSFRYLLIGNEDVTTDVDVETVLPLKKLQDILRSFADDSVINFKIKDTNVSIEIDKVKYKFKEINREGIGSVIEDENGKEYKVSKDKLLGGFKKVKVAMGDDEVRYYLNGIHLEVLEKDNETDLFFVATSGHLLATFGDKKDGFQISQKSIVPKKVIPELIKVLEKSSKDEVTISFIKNKMSLKIENLEIVVKLIEAEFPDYNRVIPQNNNKSVTFKINEFKNVLNKLSIISNADKNKDFKITTEEKIASLEVVNAEGHAANTEIVFDEKVDNFETKLNTKYIQDILAQFEKETFIVDFIDGSSPLIFRQNEVKDLLFVIMPIRA
jgi:DNA polymerase-3 subunit beta